MNYTTLFIAQIMGPIFLVVGLALMVDGGTRFKRLIAKMNADDPMMYFFGVAVMAVSIVIVLKHSGWSPFFPVGLITLFGWLGIAKGAILILSPKTLLDTSKSVTAYMTQCGVLALAIGAYFCWFAYLG